MLSDEEIKKIIIKKKRRKAGIRRALLAALLLIALFLSLQNRTVSSFDRDVMKRIGDESAKPPKLQAKAATLYSINSDRMIYEKNAHERIDPYSTTKILTCYLAFEYLDREQKVKIKKETDDMVYEDGAYLLLKEGEVLSVDDLLHGTMLSSANDSAHALALEISGSEEKFAELMNKTVKEWGCNDTNFVNPNGWKNNKHYTTAGDMAIITRNCFKKMELRKLSMEKEYTIPANKYSEQRDLFNAFLNATDGIDNLKCGKTGSWEVDDCAITLEFEEDYLKGIIVLLNDTMEKRPEDINNLKEYSHAAAPGFRVASKGDIVTGARVKGGVETDVALIIDKTINAYPKDTKERNVKLIINPKKLEAPLSKGSEAGTYTVMVDGREHESGKLYAAKAVEKGWFPSKFYISNESAKTGGLIVLAAVVLLLLRSLIKCKKRR